MRGRRRLIAIVTAFVVALFLASCRTPRSQLLVVVTLDPVDPPRARVDALRLVVRSSAHPEAPRLDRVLTIGSGPSEFAFPVSFGVYPENEAVERRVDILVQACADVDCTTQVVAARANVGFVRGETRVLTLRLTQRCEGASCADGQTCQPDTGLCVEDTVNAMSLPIAGSDAGDGGDATTRPEVVQVAAGGGATCVRMTDRSVRCAGGADSLVSYSNFPGAPSTSTFVEVPAVHGAVDIAVGFGFACAIMPDRTVQCWGGNQYGQLGRGSNGMPGAPSQVVTLHDVAQIALGGFFGCARSFDGKVSCWGLNALAQLGDGQSLPITRPSPHEIPGLTEVVEIAAGGFHACARLANGSVTCWGARISAAIGDGGLSGPRQPPTAPVPVVGIEDATQITAGGLHTCARRANGQVMCWGAATFGQIGAGAAAADTPTPVVGVEHAVEVHAGAYHTCARLADGDVLCWGRNDRGQLGDGTRENRSVATAVVGIGDAIALTVGSEHTCAQRADRSVVCWGDDSTGQLASGRALTHPLPVAAASLTNTDGLSAGALHTCALRDESAWCWGMSAGAGTLEGVNVPVQDGPRPSEATPSPVVHLAPPPDQVAVGLDFACAHMVDGTARCWGHNHLGQLGSSTGDSLVPVEVDGLVRTAEVRAGSSFACARGLDGTVKCWGDNTSGALGVSRVTQSSTRPVPLLGISTATHLSAHDAHACVRRADGSVLCWGANYTGQLGNGMFSGQPVDSPTPVVGLTDALDVGTVEVATFARTAGGGVSVWGANGIGLLLPEPSDTAVFSARPSRLHDITLYANGGTAACSVGVSGELSCWGSNEFGEVGDGTRYASNEPHRIPIGPTGDAAVSAISVADSSSCAIVSGEVYCWGENATGAVGDGSAQLRTRPVRVPGVSEAVGLSSATGQHCAITRAHDVMCWGTNAYGSLGNEPEPQPDTAVDVLGLDGAHITSVATGIGTACALDPTQGVWCWGANDAGELGRGDSLPSFRASRVAMPAGAGPITAIASGVRYACAIAGGQVFCWGANERGQQGDGTDLDRPTPHPVALFDDAVGIATMATAACALRGRDHSVWCWGGNAFGELGVGSIAPSPTPSPVHDLANVTQIVAGERFACALHDNGHVGCWGHAANGELGPNAPSLPYSVSIVDVPVRAGASRIFAGQGHACVMYDDGSRTTQCWGSNFFNQIAPGAPRPVPTPVEVTNASGADDLALGYGHTCALRSNGVSCWGLNTAHQFGDGTNTNSVLPRTVSRRIDGRIEPLGNIVAIDSSYTFSCAVRTDGGVSCWGANEAGMLGIDSRASSLLPVSVARLRAEGYGVTEIAAGAGYSCARLGNDTARCWGNNFSGQLAETAGPDVAVPPANVSAGGLPNVTRVTTGHAHACAISGGRAYCWGSDDQGQLGEGTQFDSATPVPIPIDGVVDIAAGGHHTCAIVAGGGVRCWGANMHRQLGGTPAHPGAVVEVAGVAGATHVVAGGANTCAWSNSEVTCWGNDAPPTRIAGLDHVTRVSTSSDMQCDLDLARFIVCTPTSQDHTCAVADGNVWCWGKNAHGELGDGTFTDSSTPVRVSGLTDATDVSAGGRHSCARRADGSVVCWGSDSYGQLGTGSESWSAQPRAVAVFP